jgi:hypothetical protein
MLSPAEVEDIFKETCRTDDFTKAKPERFGYGKVDAKKGLELVIQREATGIKSIDNLTIRDLRFGDGAYYDLQGRRVSDNPQSGIYIKGGKKVIIK